MHKNIFNKFRKSSRILPEQKYKFIGVIHWIILVRMTASDCGSPPGVMMADTLSFNAKIGVVNFWV